MGRLFWKFFFFFWFAQVATSAGVGIAVWLNHPEHGPGARMFEAMPPPPEFSRPDRRPPRPDDGVPPSRLPMPLMPILTGSAVSLLFAALLAWYFAKPIHSLRAAFESVAGGKLETRVDESMRHRNDELADLGSDFDRMANRLESLIEGQRRLLHDVSHELRSPLARLQAATGLLRQQPDRATEFIERIERDTGRMDMLVGELLTLARLDAGMAGQLDETVELPELLADIAEDARFEAEGKRCSIDVEMNGPTIARGSRELLHRAIENVVRNAVRHSPDDGHVKISTHASDGRLLLTVVDAGPGVSEKELASIFEPFVRSAREGSFSGYGLGLAITRRVIEAHGGSVSAVNRPEGGLVVTLELPKEKPS